MDPNAAEMESPILRFKYDPAAQAILIDNEQYNKLIISKEPAGVPIDGQIVFLDKGDFTFCTALAAYRGSWRGIVPTAIYPNDQREGRDAQARLATAGVKLWQDTLTDCFNRARSMHEWKAQVTDHTPPVRYNLDPADMGGTGQPGQTVAQKRKQLQVNLNISDSSSVTLWFQCPLRSDDPEENPQFLMDVVSSAAEIQQLNELFLIELRTDSVLANNLQTELQGYYDCLGADTEFVGEMESYGYRPSCDSNQHVTVFLLKRNEQPAETMRQRGLMSCTSQSSKLSCRNPLVNSDRFQKYGEDYQRIQISVASPPPPLPCDGPGTYYVFLGEGDFTFSTAFAAQRGSWQGMVVTGFDPDIARYKEFEIRWIRKASLKTRREWEATLNECCRSATDENNRRSMEQWRAAVARYTPPVRHHLDATYMGEDREEFMEKLGIPDCSEIVIWFQCPWSKFYSTPLDQEMFLRDILTAAAKVQNTGELLLIGLCADENAKNEYGPFVPRYGKPKGLNADYECIGADQEFVGEMINRGYRHRYSDEEKNKGKKSTLTRSDQFATLQFKKTP